MSKSEKIQEKTSKNEVIKYYTALLIKNYQNYLKSVDILAVLVYIYF